MKKAKEAFESIRKINESYGLSNDRIDQWEEEIKNARVCAPVVGKFSAGKSAMINTLLGGHYLRQDITPETALPAEIVYTAGGNRFRLKSVSGDWRDLTTDEWKKGGWTVSIADCLRLELHNEALAEIPDIMIVDMPGFESGIAVHDKAIDQYLPRSLAYILAFPADDMILRNPMKSFLTEIQIHHKPVQIAITKWDKRNPEEWEHSLKTLKNKIASVLQVAPETIPVCHTSQVDRDTEGLKGMLHGLQGQAQELLEKEYEGFVIEEAAHTENYLKSFLSGSVLTASELDAKEDGLRRKIQEVKETFEKNKDHFASAITGMADIVAADVEAALTEETDAFTAMIQGGKNIEASVNQTVRMAVARSIKGKIIPQIREYLDLSGKQLTLNEEIRNFSISAKYDRSWLGKLSRLILGYLPILLTAFTKRPMGKVIADVIHAMPLEELQRAGDAYFIRRKLQTEVYSQILLQVKNQTGAAIEKQAAEINDGLEKEMKRQQDTLTKALADVRQKMAEEAQKKKADEAAAKKALDTIHAIQAELA